MNLGQNTKNIENTFVNLDITQKRIISFDVGIKNMAYCIIDISDDSISIVDWKVLNMMNQETPTTMFCNYVISKPLPKKSKKIPIPDKICGKQAKYFKNECYFCETHAKKQTEFIIPKKTIQQSSLKKMKIEELLEICYNYSIVPRLGENVKMPTKKAILEKMCDFFNKNCLSFLVKQKDPTASDTDLISIGRNMKKILDTVQDLDKITTVIIEHQISPIATRMKTVQGMLTQYFIMKYEHMNIEYINSANKLKGFEPRNQDAENTYKQHKNDSVYHTSLILDVNHNLQSWSNILLNKKKDDYCDAFLQGLWYLKSKKLISIEQYIINSGNRTIPPCNSDFM